MDFWEWEGDGWKTGSDRGFEHGRLLGLVRVFGARVNLELGQEHAPEAIARHHALDGAVDEVPGLLRTNFRHAPALLAALPAGVGHVNLVRLLLARHAHFRGVDHHDEIA